MAETVTIIVTKDWTQLSLDQCEAQSVNDRDKYDKILFDLVVGGSIPDADTSAFMRITLFQHANFHRSAPVWLRLSKPKVDEIQPVIVIRQE